MPRLKMRKTKLVTRKQPLPMGNPTNGLKYYNLAGDAGMDKIMDLEGYEETKFIDECDIIIFNGGEDVATELYGEKPVMTRVPRYPSGRDKYEKRIYEEYRGKKFMLGICRGAQFLNVMNGGTLWQDVDNHGRDHTILDLPSGQFYRATSTHHQMMRPNFDDGILIAVASESKLRRRDGEVQSIDPKATPDLDVEIVWYPGNRTLCIQGHPEYVPGSQFANYCMRIIDEFFHEEEAKVSENA